MPGYLRVAYRWVTNELQAARTGERLNPGEKDKGFIATEGRDASTIVARIKRALPYVQAENVILAPDCGMKYLPREVAFGKMKAMAEAAKRLRAEFGAS